MRPKQGASGISVRAGGASCTEFTLAPYEVVHEDPDYIKVALPNDSGYGNLIQSILAIRNNLLETQWRS